MKEKNVHVRHIYNVTIERGSNGGGSFVLLIHARNLAQNYRTTYRLHFDSSWYARTIARLMWQPLQWLREAADSLHQALTQEPPEK